ncbi:MAG: hypothetical protein E7290_14935 [Lachnospiraceae bacterium]|nr:hypothetical protein [Lachnospiraceae bacterium]
MKKIIVTVFSMIIMLCLSVVTVKAAELGGAMSLLEATQAVKVYDAPNGTEIGELAEGTAALTIGEEQDGWIQIMYQEVKGYVQMAQMQTFGDTQALNNEYADTENFHKLVFEEMKVQKEQQTQEMLWGAIMIALVAGIFVTSILSALKKNEKERKYKPIYKGQKKAED